MPISTATLKILQPYPGLFAYYDGRVLGQRLHSPDPNWLDDGAYDLGIASYALVEGRDALVYDTHISLPHAQAIRTHLTGLGVTSLRVALSHWHVDHVAGTEVFADCEIIALRATANRLAAERESFASRRPAVAPLVTPTRVFEGRLDLTLGGRSVELHHFDIHSADGVVLWLPHQGILLAGDTLEDTVTYVAEPERLAAHLTDLDRLRTWPIRRILPNHGDSDRIAAGGYGPTLIDANRNYVRRLSDPTARLGDTSLRKFIAEDLRSGAVTYFEPYDAVHRRNLLAVGATAGGEERPDGA